LNDAERQLIRFVCSGDIKKSQEQARVILVNTTTQKDARFKEHMLKELDTKKSSLIELPYNLRQLLIAEDMTSFPTERFLLRDAEDKIVNRLLSIYKAANKLSEFGIQYLPTLMLHGDSGNGKTMLARYIAHKAVLPFVYVNFSSLMNSYLGGTQNNIGKVFEYARTSPCVLCFDEIDAVGMARGQKSDVGEMNRVVIAMMQEIDRLPNNVILIGTTNRFDRLDPALIRRFSIAHLVTPINYEDATTVADKFLSSTGYGNLEKAETLISHYFAQQSGIQISKVIQVCTEYVIEQVLHEAEVEDDESL